MKYIISISDIKGSTIVNDNLDDVYISNAIETVQDLYLQPLIGDDLYNKICEGITDEGVTLNDDYYNLVVDYIHPFLKAKVEAEIIIPIAYKMRNIGVVSNSDDHCSLPSLKDLRSVQQKYTDNASAYAARLTNYLCKNASTFVEYSTCKANKNWDKIIYLED